MDMPEILIIDDEKEICTIFKMTLERAGYSVRAAQDGDEGIRLLKEKPVDLLIVDIIMPDKDGIETIVETRKNSPHVKIMAVSGGGRISSNEYLRMAKTLGANVTLEKPVTRDVLLSTVKELLG
ncbi:Response regulator receiver domain protein (CheY-like) [Desulfatibacillum aliphaticivorans]|uniref:Response regulator receiver domain protein (CheY-like) n=2 Tax=Desulfatibacillum aliphaticivorans TaxID=218208 RepID=B8FI37_DESAL|nr:Response regulator receiver domain protein (CheY-like) [Desulfatibacillum aliphaticivorans]